MEPYALSVSEAGPLIEAGELSPVELTESVLDRIAQAEPHLTAFAEVTGDLARGAAAAAEREIVAGGYRGPLHGIPLGVKDLYDTAGVTSASSSKVRAGQVPGADATMVQLLLAAGMVVVGKTHTHEFAYGTVTPTTRNPWDPGHITGGSSGGSGAAVASGECAVGLGSDTGGSIRIPAALCGTVGLKPTYGLVSRRGVASLSWSLDHVGPLTRTVRDAALVLDAVTGYERSDPASRARPGVDHTADLDRRAEEDLSGVVVGIPTNFYTDDLDGEVDAAVRAATAVLEGLGARLVEVALPRPELLSAAALVIVRAEAAAYHRRTLRSSGDLYTEQVRRQLEIGEVVLATDYIDALRARTLVQQEWAAMVLETGVDVIAAPTCPIAAPPYELGTRTWESGLVEDLGRSVGRYSSPANLVGLPALSVPVGLSGGGLPIGMQLLGRPFDEPTVLRVGQAYEQTRPPVRPVLNV